VDALLTLVGLAPAVILALGSLIRSIRPVRPEGEGDHDMPQAINPDDLPALSARHKAVLGIKVVHYATHADFYRELWELGPHPRGWHLVAQSKAPLTGRNLPTPLLVCGDLANHVAMLNMNGWPASRTASWMDDTLS